MSNHHSLLEPCPFCSNPPRFAIIQQNEYVVSWFHCDSYQNSGHHLSAIHIRTIGTYSGTPNEDLTAYRNPARIQWNEMINLLHKNIALPNNELISLLAWDEVSDNPAPGATAPKPYPDVPF